MQLTLFALLPLLALPFASASPIPSPHPAPATRDIASTLHDHLVARSSSDPTASPAHLVARGPLTHTGVKIVSNKSGKCLSVDYRSRYPNNGDLISLVDCKSTKLWDIYQDGSVVMHDFNNMPDVASGYALDAGSSPSNGIRMKVWTSYPGVYQQTWTTSYVDKRNFKLGIKGGNQCLDEGNGVMQTWQCYNNNPNQVFHTEVPI